MPEPLSEPPPSATLSAYLNATGWARRPSGSDRAIWSKDGVRFSVPRKDSPDLLRGAIEQLATVEGLSVEDMTRTVRATWKAAHTGQRAPVVPAAVLRACGNEACSKKFAPNSSLHRYCSDACQRADYCPKFLDNGGQAKLPTGTRGAVSEMMAACNLLERGYEVFRALSPTCSCDLIALGPDQVPLRMEVRTGWRHATTGRVSYPRNAGRGKRKESDLDHYAVVIGTEVFYEPPLPGEGLRDSETTDAADGIAS